MQGALGLSSRTKWLQDGRGVPGRGRVGTRASVAEGKRIECGGRNVFRPGLARLFGMRGGALVGTGNHLISGQGDYLSGQSMLARIALRGLQILAQEQV